MDSVVTVIRQPNRADLVGDGWAYSKGGAMNSTRIDGEFIPPKYWLHVQLVVLKPLYHGSKTFLGTVFRATHARILAFKIIVQYRWPN